MSASLRWTGLDELRAELRNLPATLTGEASAIVVDAATGAKSDMHYPRRTGDLADHLTVTTSAPGPYIARARIVNTSKIAWIFENGSEARHYVTVKGVSKAVGRMPPSHVFVSTIVRKRREMYSRLRLLLVRHGLTVSGDA